MNEFFADGFPWWFIWVGFAVVSGMGQHAKRTRRQQARNRTGGQRRETAWSEAARREADRRYAAAAAQQQRLRDTEKLMADHHAVNARWLDYELDVAKLIDYPMMSDVREPLTVAFLRAKRTADGLLPVTAAEITTDERLREYREAVRAFEVAFDIAEREARRIRDHHFSGPERLRLNTARRLLTIAVDRAATPAERQLAYSRARKELDGLLALPAEALAVLQRQVNPELLPLPDPPAGPRRGDRPEQRPGHITDPQPG
jgi:hypothetical protein